MNKLKSALTRQIGPLPLGIWLVAIAAGLIFARYLQAARVDPVPEPDEDDSMFPDDRASGLHQTQGAVNLPGGAAHNVQPTEPKIEDNHAWNQAAWAYLVSRGIGASIASNALTKYLMGDPLTTQEEAVIEMALRGVGLPPEGAAAITPQDPTDSDDPTKPPWELRGEEWDKARARIRNMFVRAAIPIGTDTETGAERLDRLTTEVLMNVRSFSDVQGSVNIIRDRVRNIEWVRNLFQRYGVPIATGAENEMERLTRIADEIRLGQRTKANVEKSVQWIRSQL